MFQLLLNAVVKVVLVFLCNVVDILVELARLNHLLVVNVAVPFSSSEVVVKDIVVDIFVCEPLVEHLDVDNVALDALLPIVSHDVEHEVVVKLPKVHSLDVRYCCSRRCCPYL